MRSSVRPTVVAVVLVAGMISAPAEAVHDGDVADACPSSEVPAAGFSDVAPEATHVGTIDCLTWFDVATGVSWTRFAPGQQVRRDGMASFLARAVEDGMPLPDDPPDAFDDDDGNVHEPRIDQLAAVGLVTGRGDRRYAPHAVVSRAETATLVVRAHETVTGEELTASGDHFDDDDGTAHEGAINRAAEAGLVVGTGERRFSPGAGLTRAQMSSILVRLLDAFVERGRTARPPGWAADGPPALTAELVTDDVSFPLQVTAPPGDPRLFVVERAGRVRIVTDGQVGAAPFLDVSHLTTTDGERGLFALAFHPDHARNGYVYVHYTGPDGDTRVDRFTVSGSDPDRVDPATRTGVLRVAQPYSNHNGGMIAFGPDRMLYVALGDGGSGGDPHGHGQDRSTLLGTIVRLDVNRTTAGYAVPPDNPFADGRGGAPEVWAYGLRNPWRFDLDPATDHLFVADVGQSSREEVNVVPARRSGVNYGWARMEGTRCYGSSTCDRDGLTLPVYEYDHSQGCSITGGHVYRGSRIAGLSGHYVFGDLCNGWVRSFAYDGSGVGHVTSHDLGDLGQIYGFGRDGAGELYVATARGVFRLVAR